MVLAHPSFADPPWRRACPLFDCAVNPAHPPSPPPPPECSSPLSPPLLLLFFSFSLTSLSAQCPECAAVLCDFTMIDCGGGPPLPSVRERKWRREKNRREGNGQSRERARASEREMARGKMKQRLHLCTYLSTHMYVSPSIGMEYAYVKCVRAE